MKKIFCLLFLSVLLTGSALAQTARELQETARSFMQQGDYSNAVLVLNRATQLAPDNIDISKDLALGYYFQKELEKATAIIHPLLDREDADYQCFQIAGNIYKQQALPKDCDKLLRKGLKRFPESGPLYNDLGELLWAQQNHDAIIQWEKGIEVDPGYSKNYYNAAKYYYVSANNVWCVLYSEIFINMEPFTIRAPEMKLLLLDSYKKLFSDLQIKLADANKNNFTLAFANAMNKQSMLATTGINPETLTMIRSRFILDWYYQNGEKMPFKLFELHRELLKDGLFDAYNQWLFGSVQNLAAYQNWTLTHASENEALLKLQRGRIFKIPSGQYYH